MRISKTKLVSAMVLGLGLLAGCNNSDTESYKDTTSISDVKELSQQKNVYASANIGNGNLLFAGEEGMSIVNISSNDAIAQKQTKGFSLPIFESRHEVFKKTDGKALYKTGDDNTTEVEKSKIYSMLRVDDGIIIGGSFASVNGVEKHNIVKLNVDGTINNDFNANVGGSVYKIVKNQDKLYISGIIGRYNDKEAYSIVQTDLNGKMNENFLPLKEYLFSKINDMVQLDNEHIMLGGTFVKDASESDQNKTQEELLKLTTTVLVIDNKGQIDEELSSKFSDIKNEVFSLAVDDEKVYIAGDFQFENEGQEYNNLVAYDLLGNFDKEFQIEKLHGMIFDIEVLDDKVVFGGDFLIDSDDSTRSFYVVDKFGKTIKIDNLSTDADIYSIDIYNGNIILSGDGEFKIEDKSFTNSLMLHLDN